MHHRLTDQERWIMESPHQSSEVFYPSIYRSERNVKTDNYCKYNNQVFQLYSSSLYMAAIIATFAAAWITRKRSPRRTILMADILFSMGTVLGAGAQNLMMLILGRVLIGFGLGFSNQASPLYLSEIAPPMYRGGLNLIMLFTVYTISGVFAGNLVNYLTSQIHPWGWRLSLAMTGVLAIPVILASLVLVDTPTVLIRTGEHKMAKVVLAKIRGHAADILPEYDRLVKAVAEAEEELQANRAFRNLLRRRNVPQVTMALALPLFRKISGSNAVLFYGPFLFRAAGLGERASLYSTLITGTVAVAGNVISVFLIDRSLGRRNILIVSSFIMMTFLSMLCVFKFGTFFFFAGWQLAMGLFTIFFLPETKCIPIDDMVHVWRAHWFWRYFVDPPQL